MRTQVATTLLGREVVTERLGQHHYFPLAFQGRTARIVSIFLSPHGEQKPEPVYTLEFSDGQLFDAYAGWFKMAQAA